MMHAAWRYPLPVRRHLAWRTAFLLAVLCAWRLAAFRPPPLEGFDETIYAYYAEVLARDGVAGLRRVLAVWEDHPQLRLGPLPLRIGFIGPVALAVRGFAGEGTFAPAVIAVLCGALLIPAGYALAHRWMRPTAATMTALLLTASPLGAGLSLRALQDTQFALLVVLALWLFDRALERRRALDTACCGLVLLAGFLTKESMLFIYPMLFAIVLLRVPAREWLRHWPLIAVCAAAPALAGLVILWVAGSADQLWQVYRAYGRIQREIPYALTYQRGPWFRYLVDFTLVAPMIVILAWCSLLRERTGFRAGGASRAAAVLLVGLAVFACLPLRNIRLVLFLDVPLRMLAVAGAGGLAAAVTCSRVWQPRLAGLLVALAALLDVLAFRALFLGGQVYDPITANLIRALGFMDG